MGDHGRAPGAWTGRIAIVDGASFVLPYDWALTGALTRRGASVGFYGSTTRYNAAFLDAIRAMPGVVAHVRPVSRTVSPRRRGVWGYARLLASLWRERGGYDSVHLQFSVLWPLEIAFLFALRDKLVFTVHNAVPHGFAARRHGATQRLAALARTLVFVSEATRDDFLQRYGDGFAAKSQLLPHGTLPVAPGDSPVSYDPDLRRISTSQGSGGADGSSHDERLGPLVFWGNVKPYKGVDLFTSLAKDAGLRARVDSLEVLGAWAPSLAPLRDELAALGVVVVDAYLDADALHALMQRDAVFLLPYREASQSGALYTLLHHGRVFICADVGDLGAFMRRFGLAGLLLRDRSVPAVADCLDHWRRHRAELLRALQAAQQACDWDRLLAAATPHPGSGAQ